jgi:hypothetical protein
MMPSKSSVFRAQAVSNVLNVNDAETKDTDIVYEMP